MIRLLYNLIIGTTYLIGIDRFMYRVGRKIVFTYDNEMNSDAHTNGEFAFLKRNVNHFETVFDVGANFGEWPRYINKLSNTVVTHCFEPEEYAFRELSENNFSSSVRLNRCGLSSKKGSVELHTWLGHSGGSSLHNRPSIASERHGTQIVTVTTIDDYCRAEGIAKIDLLKIDTEGHDLEVIKGGKEMIREGKISAIQFEYGDCWIDSRSFLRDVFDFLGPQYQMFKIFPDRIEPVQYEPLLENFHYANYVAVREELAGVIH